MTDERLDELVDNFMEGETVLLIHRVDLRRLVERIAREAVAVADAYDESDSVADYEPQDGLATPLAMKLYAPSSLPTSVAGRHEFVALLLSGLPIYDEDGEPTGEYTEPLITKEHAARLLAAVDAPVPPSTPGVSVEEKP